jgi:hypothetical protein
MKTFLGIIFGGIVSALAGVGAHFLIERLNREKVRREKFQTALTELEKELHRLIARIDSGGVESWGRKLLERKWKAVQQYLTKEAEFQVSSEAQNAIGSLGDAPQHSKTQLQHFLNGVTGLINTADKVYDAGSKGRKKEK